MATNLRSRLERLEQQMPSGAAVVSLIVLAALVGWDEAEYSGVMHDGVFVPCRRGQTAHELKEGIIASLERDGRRGIVAVYEV